MENVIISWEIKESLTFFLLSFFHFPSGDSIFVRLSFSELVLSFLRTCKKKEYEIIYTIVKRDSFLLMRNVKYELKPGNKMLDAFTSL
jgi:hypothetical protein